MSAHALQCQACLCRDARPLGPEEAEPVISALPGCRCRRPPCEVRLSGWQVSSPACDARLAGPVIARPEAQRTEFICLAMPGSAGAAVRLAMPGSAGVGARPAFGPEVVVRDVGGACRHCQAPLVSEIARP